MTRAKAKPVTRVCEHCGVEFETHQNARFCTRAHKNAASNLEKSRGQAIYRAAYRWRALRGKNPKASNDSLTHLTWLLSQFIDEDRTAGILPPPPPTTAFEYATAHKTPKRDKSLRKSKEAELIDKVFGPGASLTYTTLEDSDHELLHNDH